MTSKPTKRSAQVRLLLMGSAAVALAGCGEDAQKAEVYASVDECIASGVYTETYCRNSFEQAKKEHPRVAPRYASQSDCEADFGATRCEYRPQSGVSGGDSGGGSFWLPLMSGFLVSQALNSLGRSAEPLYRPDEGRRNWSGSSTYYSPGSWRTGSNTEVSRSTGSTWVKPSSISPAPRTTTISRGGFGSRASSFGVSS
ncbi:MAG: DUF1190 domain-containing protein [Azospirillum sp.]|nr:DUF1190 domain-containing protein [Azospirillum sp.]